MEELGWSVIYFAIFVAGFFLRGLLSGYAGEKGKNLATKEDIGEITEKVEDVKNVFSTQLERLKADLNADIQRQMNLFVKRNEALAQFFEDAFTVVTLLHAGFHFSYEDKDGLDRHIRQGQDRIVRAITSCYRLMLYVQEESILTPARNALKAIDTLNVAWFELALNFLDAFTIEIDEYKRNGSVTSRHSIHAAEELRKGTDDAVNTLEVNMKEYAKALYAHSHPADNSKALATTTGDSPEK